MPNYNIVTDSCCDLRPETYEQLNLTVVPLSMEFRGQVREDKSDDSIKEVYAALRAGESAQTAAVNPDRWLNAMEPHLAEGRDVLVMVLFFRPVHYLPVCRHRGGGAAGKVSGADDICS